MTIAFVADLGFDDFSLLARAFSVALEGEVIKGETDIKVYSVLNGHLKDLLIQLADTANSYLSDTGLRIQVLSSVAPKRSDGTWPTTMVVMTPVSSYLLKSLVKRAKTDRNTTVLEY
jgi:hypothetical protein